MMAYDEISGGSWSIDETGAVFAEDGAPYLGGLNNHPEYGANPTTGHVVGITFWRGKNTNTSGNGYVIGFRFLNSPKPSLYRFDRDGNANKKK